MATEEEEALVSEETLVGAAVEITLAIIDKHGIHVGSSTPETIYSRELGRAGGEIFKAVLQEVKEAAEEAFGL